MGKYCLENGKFAQAQVGEVLAIQDFRHTTAVVNDRGIPVCIPHGGASLELVSVGLDLAQHPVLNGLRPGHSVHYEIVGAGQTERDVITLKTGEVTDLKELKGCTFQIVEEKPTV